MKNPYILILYASTTGNTKKMAEIISRGVLMVPGVDVCMRTVPTVNELIKGVEESEKGAVFATVSELEGAGGLAVGSPTRFGNMASGLQYFLEQTSAVWFKGGMVGKPFSVFTSSGSMHGGQETTLMNMAVPLLHHGMIQVGIPYTESQLNATQSGGSPYGATHVSGEHADKKIDKDEHALLVAQGRRLAKIAKAVIEKEEVE